MISRCPVCNTELVRNKAEVDHYCPNDFCDSKIIESLIHFASRKTMNIEGLGDRIVEQFYNDNLLKTINDIYTLKDHYEDLITKEGFGKSSKKR